MADTDPPSRTTPDPADSETLRARVQAAQARYAPQRAGNEAPSAASLAMRFGGEFGSAVLVGAGLGFGVDHWVHTGPWGLIIGLTAGFAAGIVNVVRAARAYSDAHPVDTSAPSIPDDAED